MILIDPGHGYNTAGKRSPVWSDGSQLMEWEFNRDVAHRLLSRLVSLSIPATIIVQEALDISLRTRCQRVNDLCRQYPGSFLISIHGNAGGGKGWEIWTSKGETESDKIATIFYTEARALLKGFIIRTDYSDGDPDKESAFYILKNTICPAVLTENLFYDNEAECRFMMSDFGRELIAKLHQFAICSYLQSHSS